MRDWRDCARLPGLGRDQRCVLLGQSDHLRRVRKGAVKGVGQRGRKGRSEQIDVDLQVPRTVQPLHSQHTAPAVGGTHQVQSEVPHRRAVERFRRTGFGPAERVSGAASGRRVGRFERNNFPREQFELQFETVEIVAIEGRGKNAANLIVVARDFELLGSAADGQVVDEDLRLVEGAVGDAGQFAKFEIAEMLDANPDPDAKHR